MRLTAPLPLTINLLISITTAFPSRFGLFMRLTHLDPAVFLETYVIFGPLVIVVEYSDPERL